MDQNVPPRGFVVSNPHNRALAPGGGCQGQIQGVVPAVKQPDGPPCDSPRPVKSGGGIADEVLIQPDVVLKAHLPAVVIIPLAGVFQAEDAVTAKPAIPCCIDIRFAQDGIPFRGQPSVGTADPGKQPHGLLPRPIYGYQQAAVPAHIRIFRGLTGIDGNPLFPVPGGLLCRPGWVIRLRCAAFLRYAGHRTALGRYT